MATGPGGEIFPAAGNGYHVNCPTLRHEKTGYVTFGLDKFTRPGSILGQSSSKVVPAGGRIARIDHAETHILPRLESRNQ
jgi:hypothetical protein